LSFLDTLKPTVLPDNWVGYVLPGAVLWALGHVAAGVKHKFLSSQPQEPNSPSVSDAYEQIEI
jgi:hypothetical protein